MEVLVKHPWSATQGQLPTNNLCHPAAGTGAGIQCVGWKRKEKEGFYSQLNIRVSALKETKGLVALVTPRPQVPTLEIQAQKGSNHSSASLQSDFCLAELAILPAAFASLQLQGASVSPSSPPEKP